MAKRKEESLLGLPPLSADPTFSRNGSLAPYGSSFGGSRALTRDERRILDEWRKQRLVIMAQAEKTNFAQSKIAEIHQHGTTTYAETVGSIMAIKQAPRGREEQRYIDEFSHRQIQLVAHHLFGAIEAGATGIGVEVHRSLYPPELPPPGLLQRLFDR